MEYTSAKIPCINTDLAISDFPALEKATTNPLITVGLTVNMFFFCPKLC